MKCHNYKNDMTVTMISDANARQANYRCDACGWVAQRKGHKVKWYPRWLDDAIANAQAEANQ